MRFVKVMFELVALGTGVAVIVYLMFLAFGLSQLTMEALDRKIDRAIAERKANEQ